MNNFTMENQQEQRLKLLDGIKQFTDDTDEEMTFILQSLGWSGKDLKNKMSIRSKCHKNSSHLIGPSNMKNHLDRCDAQIKCLDELFPSNCNNNPETVINIDKELSLFIIAEAAKQDPNFMRGIQNTEVDTRSVPLSYNQMIMNFTTDERKALYDYTISLSPTIENVFYNTSYLQSDTERDQDVIKGSLKELAMIRDMKRRRTKYKVSTKSKSYMEVMREIINNLMSSHIEDLNNDHDNYVNSQHIRPAKRKRH